MLSWFVRWFIPDSAINVTDSRGSAAVTKQMFVTAALLQDWKESEGPTEISEGRGRGDKISWITLMH